MEHKVDRISKLPKPILEHILSFTRFYKILQLSILSKGWQNVWTLFPLRDFNQMSIFERSSLEIPEDKERELFNYFVERTLLSRYSQGLSINKFSLAMDKILDCALLNRWIGYATESNVKDFSLYIWPDEFDEYYYEVPESILAAKSITKLNLCGVKFKSFYNDINLSSLKKLILSQVYVEDQVVQILIAGCPLVEDVTLEHCYGLKSLHVSRLPKLKALLLFCNPILESVGMEASNLESTCLSGLCQFNLVPFENLKKLQLSLSNMTDKWLHDVLFKHPLIEILDLCNCNMLKRIKISSHRMKSLTIISCIRLVEVKIVTPNLQRLKYGGGAISFSLNTSTLLEINLNFKSETWDVEKIEFLAKLSHPKLLTWDTLHVKSVIIPKELRENLLLRTRHKDKG